jgi:Peptidase M60, enhancin and enhancin-like
MGHLDMAPVWTSKKRLQAYDQNASWAMFHETGHNHQDDAWTPAGTVEVTCNLFSLYCAQQLHGITENAHNALALARAQAVDHKRRGSPFEVWKNEPFLALQTYRELIDAYGWDTMKAVIASYSDPSFGPRPTTDAERFDGWALRYSTITKRDLSEHFIAWGIPLSKSTVAACRRV